MRVVEDLEMMWCGGASCRVAATVVLLLQGLDRGRQDDGGVMHEERRAQQCSPYVDRRDRQFERGPGTAKIPLHSCNDVYQRDAWSADLSVSIYEL